MASKPIKNAFYFYDNLGQKKRVRNIRIVEADLNATISDSNTLVYMLGEESLNWQNIDFNDAYWINSTEKSREGTWATITGAKFIWYYLYIVYSACLFRRVFYLDKIVGNIKLLFNFDDIIELYINGVLVFSEFTSKLRNWQQVHEIDITQYLHVGNNIIAAKITDTMGRTAMFQYLITTPQQTINRKRVVKYKKNNDDWGGVTI